ncbi:MAG: MFS transporter [Neisseriaceae bacterium]|nr:MFS transporter [Neisseriaceae bacterium]
MARLHDQPLKQDHFPLSPLLAFAMTGFTAILTEILPAGLLPQISQDLAISEAYAGQMITLFAFGALVSVIPLIALTRSWNRKTVLMLAIAGFLVFNTITAVSHHYGVILAARLLAGISAGLCWGLLAGYARRLVHPTLQGKALAIAMFGTPVAFSIGLPLGTWLGSLLGWRTIFFLISLLGAVLLTWVWRGVPGLASEPNTQRLSLRQVFTLPGMRSILAVIFIWIVAHNLLYTYISPFLVHSGLAERVDTVLLVFGSMALASIILVGFWVDRLLRSLTLFSLILFAFTATLMGIWSHHPGVVFVAVGLWGLSFGGSATLLITASADAAHEAVDTAQSIVVTTWNLAVACGSLVGGLLLGIIPVIQFPWPLLVLALVSLSIVWIARSHGFKPGPR